MIDADERFYLDWSSQILGACEQPYYQRRELLESLRTQLHERRTTADYPFLAARVLLSNVHRGHEIQARDRELFEAWALALAHALDRPVPPYRISPFSGREYGIYDEDGYTEVTLFPAVPGNRTWSVIVPWPAREPADADMVEKILMLVLLMQNQAKVETRKVSTL